MNNKDEHSELDANQSPDAYLLPYPIEFLSKPIPVTPNRATIGRSSQNTIIIDSATVSRRHAVIISREGNYFVKDMDSRNGTFINGAKVSVSRVEPHNRVTFGNHTFLFLKKSGEAGPQETDHMIDANSTIVLSRDEIEPSDFLAYAAEDVRFGMFPHKEKDAKPEDQEIKPLKQAHHRLSLLYRLSERLRATQIPREILIEGLDLILEAIPSAERAVIMLRSGRGGTLEVTASRNRNNEESDAGVQISRTLLDWVLTEKMALMTQNVSDDIRLKDAESIKVSHLNAVICVPIIVTEKVIGILYVDSGDLFEQMTQEDVTFTAAVAHELALTIVNIKLQKSAIRNERMAAIGLTVSNMAHNIKNLTMINQNAGELMQIHLDRIGDEKADACWKIIHKSLTQINNLSVDMLAYVGDQELSPTPTDINRVIRANTDFFTQSPENKEVKLYLELSEKNPRWMIDEKQFQRALLNIIVNAVDAIGNKPDGQICITTTVENGRRLVVAVQDNGSGIDPEKKQKIFDLFYTTKGTNGSGLGLPMVNKFIESSGGKLRVESEKGVGTTFKMVFPLNPIARRERP